MSLQVTCDFIGCDRIEPVHIKDALTGPPGWLAFLRLGNPMYFCPMHAERIKPPSEQASR